MTEKQIMACAAIIDILRIFADSEIGGQYEFDYAAIAAYLESFKFAANYFECSTKEEVYERFTSDIYAGLPVWNFLVLPEWTKTMVERSFDAECKATFKELCRKYKCLTCTYYEAQNTELGVLSECKYEQSQPRRMSERWHVLKRRDEPFELQEQCDNYKPKQVTDNL